MAADNNPFPIETDGEAEGSINSILNQDMWKTVFKKCVLLGWIPATPQGLDPDTWGPSPYRRLHRAIGPVFDTLVTCPASSDCVLDTGPIGYVIIHLNDAHCWSKAKIATWVDSLPLDLTIKPQTTDKEQ
jgi:hypothetical protein